MSFLPYPGVWLLGGLAIVWGLTLIVRLVRLDLRSDRRACPACGLDLPDGHACTHCLYEAMAERDLHPRRAGLLRGSLALLVVASGIGALVYAEKATIRIGYSGSLESAVSPIAGLGAIIAVIGAELLVWARRADPSRGRRRCPSCWYDMAGAASLMCPECGRTAASSRDLYRCRARRRLVAAGAMLALAGVALPTSVRATRDGWVAAVPTTVLIAGLPWLPDSLVTGGARRGNDWSLRGRVGDNRLWEWQEDWLRSKARSIAVSTADQAVLDRACEFVEYGARLTDDEYFSQVQSLLRPSAESRARAATVLARFEAYVSRAPSPLEGKLRPLVPQLLSRLDDQDDLVAAAAAWVLALCGDAAVPATPKLIEMLARAPSSRAAGASVLLRRLYAVSSESRAAIIAALGNTDASIRRGAERVARSGDINDPGVCAALRAMIRDGDDGASAAAARVACYQGSYAAEVLPEVVAQLDGGRTTRAQYVEALQVLAAVNVELLAPYGPRIAAALGDADADVRTASLDLVASLAGEPAIDLRAALPALRVMGSDPDPEIQEKANTAIGRITEWGS